MSLNFPRTPSMLDETRSVESIAQSSLGKFARVAMVLKDVTGIELPSPARKTIDLEGRIVKDGVRKAI